MSNETTLDDVLGLVAKATPGEWAQSHRKTPTGGYSTEVYDEDGQAIAAMAWHEKPDRFEDGKRIVSTDRPENAEAIAAAVNYLRAHGAELRAALEDARRYRWLRRHAQRIEWVDAGATETFEWETDAETTEDDDLTLDAAIDAAQATP